MMLDLQPTLDSSMQAKINALSQDPTLIAKARKCALEDGQELIGTCHSPSSISKRHKSASLTTTTMSHIIPPRTAYPTNTTSLCQPPPLISPQSSPPSSMSTHPAPHHHSSCLN
jgi:hypothetical protein